MTGSGLYDPSNLFCSVLSYQSLYPADKFCIINVRPKPTFCYLREILFEILPPFNHNIFAGRSVFIARSGQKRPKAIFTRCCETVPKPILPFPSSVFTAVLAQIRPESVARCRMERVLQEFLPFNLVKEGNKQW